MTERIEEREKIQKSYRFKSRILNGSLIGAAVLGLSSLIYGLVGTRVNDVRNSYKSSSYITEHLVLEDALNYLERESSKLDKLDSPVKLEDMGKIQSRLIELEKTEEYISNEQFKSKRRSFELYGFGSFFSLMALAPSALILNGCLERREEKKLKELKERIKLEEK